MATYSIRDNCKVNTNYESDTFVGVRIDDGKISVHFPLGYRIADSDNELRRDIISLLSIIGSTTGKKDSEINGKEGKYVNEGFPVQAYLAIIKDFHERGYYKERDVEYSVSKKGKIDWSRTVKSQKPYIQGNEAYYLDFIVKKSNVNENELVTLIHEYCVYESFEKMGWLFSAFLPPRPRIKFNRKLFNSVVREKLLRTFNDRNKELFVQMLRVINNISDNSSTEYLYGTYRFEYVWESMIDRVFGVKNKSDYFPKTSWIINEKAYENASLEPDTIMIYKDSVFVLDAKYYKYGSTRQIWDLPESTSINKQITYGEYVSKIVGNSKGVYNAFIMPFDALDSKWPGKDIIPIGEAVGNWRTNDKKYEHIQGILVDVKGLMRMAARKDQSKIGQLAECIVEAVGE